MHERLSLLESAYDCGNSSAVSAAQHTPAYRSVRGLGVSFAEQRRRDTRVLSLLYSLLTNAENRIQEYYSELSTPELPHAQVEMLHNLIDETRRNIANFERNISRIKERLAHAAG